MKKAIFLLILAALLLVGGIFLASAINASYLRPIGPGLGYHNDWWNPQTQRIQNTPYIEDGR